MNLLIQDVKTGPFMDFEVKKDMRIAPLCRIPDLDVVNMIKRLDEHLIRQVVNEFCQASAASRHRRRLYVFGSSVRAAVHACVRDSRGSFMFPRYLQYLLIDFRQTFVTGASWDTDDLITFLG